MMKWRDLIELRYNVISGMGYEAVLEAYEFFKKNKGKTVLPNEFDDYEHTYGYMDSIIDFHNKKYPHWKNEEYDENKQK